MTENTDLLSIKESMAQMSEMFNKRMLEFQEDLKKTSTTTSLASPPTRLASDFTAFRSFVITSLQCLQTQVGKPQENKPRPILCKLRNLSDKELIWSSKISLKGTGITLSEFLTKSRHEVFMAAREHLVSLNAGQEMATYLSSDPEVFVIVWRVSLILSLYLHHKTNPIQVPLLHPIFPPKIVR
ncbi:unnamed protein product [Colias eurytheme]|nr:unnamed protein product [Colias eurytheme]